jgi:DNA-binding PadR family transcriptional regulator
MSTVHAVLWVLAEGDCHGYEIAARLADRVGTGPYNSGQIHQALELIERKGWAIADADVLPSRARREFSITPAGRREFMHWLSRPIPAGRAQRDDVVLKMVFLAQQDLPRLIRLLDDRKREYMRRLAALQREPISRRSAKELIRSLVRDRFRFQDETEVEWIERCSAELRAWQEPVVKGAKVSDRIQAPRTP